MNTDLNIHLSAQAFVGLQKAALASGRTPAEVAQVTLEQMYSVSSGEAGKGVELNNVRRIEEHFGAIDIGMPIGSDNAQIDADLARAYGDVGDQA
jgi:hypothetical protein